MRWTEQDIPDQSGRTAIVTGANTGIGFETARALAERGADVVLACRSAEKGQDAVARILAAAPTAHVSFESLDLADLEDVAAFAARLRSRRTRLDLLVNNAGVMVPPASTTKQGFELQFGVNHLGHFALTANLLPLLRATPGARVVAVASQAHRMGRMNWDDLQFSARYQPWPAYGQSKLANLLFTLALQARFEEAGVEAMAVAAHPGWTGTDLQRNSPIAAMMGPLLAMGPAQGALPTLRAATDPAATGADYYGPDGLQELRGYPVKVGRTRAALDAKAAQRLWEESEAMTGVRCDFTSSAA